METLSSNSDTVLINTQVDEYYEDVKPENITRSIEALAQNPYPGLRPFRTSESAVFFGRQEISSELIKRLSEYNFLAVIGASGTGKSSMVRAGLLPKLQSLPGKFGEWRVAILRPGQDPFANLARALCEAKILKSDLLPEIINTLKESSFGFEKLYKSESFSENQAMQFNTLIVVDQFEELFRYRRDNGISGLNDAALFVKMLISISENRELNTYVLLTMRTEYINECVQIPDLAEKINNGQFLVPSLSINQLKETISLPLMLSGAKAEEGIENKIIGELGEIGDQLPVLQHALRATFEHGKHNKGYQLSYDDYKAIGKIQNAINKHADHLYDNLNERQKLYCKLLFQCLTERTNDGRLIRRPKQFGLILNICVKDENTDKDLLRAELIDIVDRFRADDVSFLMPPDHVPLSDDVEIDISHESLMRNWTRLKKWIDEEVYYGNLYRYLNDSRRNSEKKPDSDEWITGGKLDDLLDWRDHYTNNAAWAARYTLASDESTTEAYSKNLVFLEESKQRNEKRIQHELDIKNQLEDERLLALELQNRLETTRLQAESTSLKEKRRWSLLLLAFIFLAGTTFGFILVHKNIQIRSKANQVIKDSIKQADLIAKAEKLTDAAKRSDSAAMKAQISAKHDSLNAERFYRIAKAKQLAIDKERIEFNKEKRKIIETQALAMSASQRKSDSLQKEIYVEVIKNDFQNSKLSSIASIDSTLLNDAANYSLKLINNGRRTEYQKFLADMDSVFYLNSQMDSDPVIGIKQLKKKWSNSSNPVLQKLILDVINSHLYYKQKFFTSNYFFNSGAATGNSLINNIEHNNNFAYLFIPKDKPGLKKDASHTYHVVLQAGKLRQDSLVLNTSLNPDIFEPVTFLQYTGDGIVGANNKTLFRWNDNGALTQNQLKNKANENILAVSNDGRYIVSRSSKTADCRVWNTPDYIADKNPIQVKNTANIMSVEFAPDSKYLLITTLNGNSVYEFPSGLSKSKYGITTIKNEPIPIQYFNPRFAPDGEHLIFSSRYSNKLYLTGLDGTVKDRIILNYPNNKTASVQSVSLSPDFRRLIIEDYYGIYLLNKANGDSILSVSNSHIKSNVNYISIPNIYSRAAFLDNSSMITYDRSYNIFLWKLYPNFKDIGEALSSIKLYESISDKLSSGKMSFEQMISSNDKSELLEAANYYLAQRFNPDNYLPALNHSKEIYYKLLGMSDADSYEQGDYTQTILIINDYLYAIGSETLFANNVKCLKENIAIEEKYFAKSVDVRRLSTYYGNLSWNSFFVKDFQTALDAAKKGLSIDKTNGFIVTNLALGYLFTKDFNSAERVYGDYKDKTYDVNVLYKDSFKDDIQNLTKHHIIDPADKEIYGEVQHILNQILR